MTASQSDRRSTAFVAASVPENYQQRLAPVLFEPWATLLVETVGVRPGDRVFDVASGTGVVARLAARHAGSTGRVWLLTSAARCSPTRRRGRRRRTPL